MATFYRAVFALVGVGTLGLQYWLHLTGRGDLTVTEVTVRYFSYFTVLTNLMAAAIMALPVVAGTHGLGRWAASGPVRSAVLTFIAVAGLAYHFLLSATWNPQGLLYPVNIVLHYVMPTALLIDWLVLTPKGRLSWADPVRWLAFPLAFGGWTVVHGLASGWWPYGFINVDVLGWAREGVAFGGLLLAFLFIGCILVGVDRMLGRGDRRARAA